MPRNVIDEIFLEDSSFCDPDDMWGLNVGVEECQYTLPNPAPAYVKIKKVTSSRATPKNYVMCGLWAYGVTMSFNSKTAMSISTWLRSTCAPTKWCKKHCYGLGTRMTGKPQIAAYKGNTEAFNYMETADEFEVNQLADSMVRFCMFYNVPNIRWSGVGDLTPGQVRVIVAICNRHPDFTVWGFTKKGWLLMDSPVRDNMVFWASIDYTTPEELLQQQIKYAKKHKTGLAYATDYGIPHRIGKARKTPLTKRAQSYIEELLEPDPYLIDLTNRKIPVPISVIFGLHSSRQNTRVGITYNDKTEENELYDLNECPATDPYGGGHFYAACQQCYWCVEKPHNREYYDLLSYKKIPYRYQ